MISICYNRENVILLNIGGFMEITEISLVNFKGFKNLDLKLQSKNILITGVNGSGKSSILEAVNLVLCKTASNYTPYKAIPIKDEDIKNGTSSTTLSVTLDHKGTKFNPILSKEKNKRSSGPKNNKFNTKDIKDLIDNFRLTIDSETMLEPIGEDLPIFVCYPTDRNVLQVPVRIRTKHLFDQVSAYENAFNSGIDFKIFFEWYRNQEDIENENKNDVKDPILESVRQAIYAFQPQFSNLKIQRKLQRMVVDKEGETLSITQLSDGEKILLALVGDLARRLALANPLKKNPNEGEGIVLVDEIDLHLHPSLQRDVMKRLPKTFPNVQFILTTHSPQILGSSDGFDILFIDREETTGSPYARFLKETYGKDSNLILEEFMGASSRDNKIKKQIEDMFTSISQNDLASAKELFNKLESTLGNDEPKLRKADFMINRLSRG